MFPGSSYVWQNKAYYVSLKKFCNCNFGRWYSTITCFCNFLRSNFCTLLFGWYRWNPFFLVGLDAAGKTTILYKLKLGEIVTTIPTIGKEFVLFLITNSLIVSSVGLDIIYKYHSLCNADVHLKRFYRTLWYYPSLVSRNVSKWRHFLFWLSLSHFHFNPHHCKNREYCKYYGRGHMWLKILWSLNCSVSALMRYLGSQIWNIRQTL